jgi:N-acetylated-alpha-linked acidic dipeptidase
LRLANADAIPLDPEASAGRIAAYLREIGQQITGAQDRPGAVALSQAAADLQKAAAEFNRRRSSAIERDDVRALASLNRAILRFERAFLDDGGLPGRPWYRHLVYAPQFTYEPLVLPGLAGALARNDGTFDREARRLAAALRRAAAALD